MARFLWFTCKDNKHRPQDALLLRSVLEHALTVPMEIWLTEDSSFVQEWDPDEPERPTPRRAYDALHQQRWNISAPNFCPGIAIELQKEYVESAFIRTSITDTIQGLLLEAVLSAMATSPWRPVQHDVWALLWDTDAHGYYNYDYPSRPKTARIQALKKAREAFPQYAGLALTKYMTNRYIGRHTDQEYIFPFPFDVCHEGVTLTALVMLWSDEDEFGRARTRVRQLLTQHHPDVAYFLEMHQSLYDQPKDAIEAAGGVLEAFQEMLGLKVRGTLCISDMALSALNT